MAREGIGGAKRTVDFKDAKEALTGIPKVLDRYLLNQKMEKDPEATSRPTPPPLSHQVEVLSPSTGSESLRLAS